MCSSKLPVRGRWKEVEEIKTHLVTNDEDGPAGRHLPFSDRFEPDGALSGTGAEVLRHRTSPGWKSQLGNFLKFSRPSLTGSEFNTKWITRLFLQVVIATRQNMYTSLPYR